MFGMTLAGEMDRYGVTVNVICPSGLTRMTEDLSADFGSDEQQALKETAKSEELVLRWL